MDSLTRQLLYEWAEAKEKPTAALEEMELELRKTGRTALTQPQGPLELPRLRKHPPFADFLLSPTVNQAPPLPTPTADVEVTPEKPSQ